MIIDLNVDIGEGFSDDDALLEVATSANVCCGEHAGSWELTEETVAKCRERGIRVGAHPGFNDRENMGRSIPTIERALDSFKSVRVQVQRVVDAFQPEYIKPHGALYNLVAATPGATAAHYGLATSCVLDLYERFRLPLMLLPVGALAPRLQKANALISEGFADRGYDDTGRLLHRGEPGAVLNDLSHICEQAVSLAEKVDSICLHGDTPNCVEIAHAVRKALTEAGYEVRS